MTDQENTKVHGNTKKAADMSLAKRAISPDSHRAVLDGTLSLEEARSLGREGSPYGPAPKPVNKDDRSRNCLCGCENRTRGGRFVPGHDMRMVTLAKAYVRGEAELTDEQAEYLETSGKLDRARAQVEKEERKRQRPPRGRLSGSARRRPRPRRSPRAPRTPTRSSYRPGARVVSSAPQSYIGGDRSDRPTNRYRVRPRVHGAAGHGRQDLPLRAASSHPQIRREERIRDS